jgi:response regulator RpfG family c-di-GMP phosphodiesterase
MTDPPAASPDALTVLVVDDEPSSNVTSIEKIFQRDGMRVLTAERARRPSTCSGSTGSRSCSPI